MRVNEPITTHEIAVPSGKPLVSRTDLGGRITFANKAFVEISGFSRDELIGQPHSIVRHPHMPKEAFANLWATIKAGRPWEGLVKNRSKVGDFYWVKANVTPVVEDGEVTGFISIRATPTREQVAQAEAAYASLREGKGQGIALRDGQLVGASFGSRCKTALVSIGARLGITATVAILAMLLASWLGLQGMAASDAAMRLMYEEGVADLTRMTDIRAAMRGSVQDLTLLALRMKAGSSPLAQESVRTMRTGAGRIESLLKELAHPAALEEFDPGHQFAGGKSVFVRDGLLPAIDLAERGDAAALEAHLSARLVPLFDAAKSAINALIESQVHRSEARYLATDATYRGRVWLAAAVVVFSFAAIAALNVIVLRSIRQPLRQIGVSFDAIARNDLAREIPMPAAREFWQIVCLLRAMRARLRYAVEERAESELQAQVDRREAVRAMAETVENDARQSMERIAEATDTMTRQAGLMAELADNVSSNARGVSEAAGVALANAQAVGAASEELSASIQEISGQVSRASEIALRAVHDGERAQHQFGRFRMRRFGSATSCSLSARSPDKPTCWR